MHSERRRHMIFCHANTLSQKRHGEVNNAHKKAACGQMMYLTHMQHMCVCLCFAWGFVSTQLILFCFSLDLQEIENIQKDVNCDFPTSSITSRDVTFSADSKKWHRHYTIDRFQNSLPYAPFTAVGKESNKARNMSRN